MQRKKLVIFCNDYGYFLAHRYQMFEQLAASDEVIAWCGGSFPDKALSLAFPVRRFACDRYRFRPLLDLYLLLQMIAILIREKPDVIHTITIKPNLFGGLAARLAGLLSGHRPRLVMASPGLGRLFSAAPTGLPASLRRLLIARALRFGLSGRDSCVFFENEDDRNVWISENIVPRGHTEVIAGTGVDPARFYPVSNRTAPPPLRLLYGGRLLKSKGVVSFLEIARRCAQTGLSVEFLVAGAHDRQDPDSVDLSAIGLPENVSVLGHVADMPALIETVHAIMLPSVYAEGLPRILLEGAAMNCVLLASDIAGCRRAVTDGQNGFLLPIENGEIDSPYACEKIRFLAEKPDVVARMGERSHAHFVANCFDIRSVRAHVRDILFGKSG